MNVREDLLRARIDPALTSAFLSQAASRALGRRVTVSGWEPLQGGCWNRVIGLAGDAHAEGLVLKISPEPRDEALEREARVLEWFARRTRLPVPAVHLVDSSGSEIPGSFLVMDRVSGRSLHEIHGRLDDGQRRQLTIRIAEEVAELHQQTGSGFGGVEGDETDRKGWAGFWLPRFDSVVAEVAAAGLVPRAFLQQCADLRPCLPALLDIGARGTLTHYDLWPGNLMIRVDPDGVRVSGYLDVGGYWADAARELSFAGMFGIADRLFLEVYASHHPLPPEWTVRRDLYDLKMHLKHITMYPAEGFYRAGARRCLAALLAHLGA